MSATGARRRVLVLVAPSIRSGGMERLVSILARGFDQSKHELHLVVLEARDENRAFWETLPPDVGVTHLGKRSRLDALAVAWRLRSFLRRVNASAAIGFMTYSNLLLLVAVALSGRRVQVVATEHVTPDRMASSLARRIQYLAASVLYRRALRVVAVSEGMRSALVQSLRLPASRLAVIYNPFDPELDAMADDGPPPHPWLEDGGPTILAVGRLVAQKAYPDLLRAVAQLGDGVPARLIILGDGPERAALEQLADRLGIRAVVDLPGYRPNPFRYMRLASVYVLSSEWEGFPFVLVEASRTAAAIVSTDCPFGPSEIIDDEVSGILVPTHDPASLAVAIRRVLQDRTLAKRLGIAARSRSDRFAPATAVQAYEELLTTPVGTSH